MTTRCPQCGTSFKVVPDQLRVRNGLVRCGECATVFDGRACLVAPIPDDVDSASEAPVPMSPAAVAETLAPASLVDAAPSPPAAGEATSAAHPAPASVQPPAEPATPVGAANTREPGAQIPAVLRGRSDIARQDPYLDETAAHDDDEAADGAPAHYATERLDHDEVIFNIGENRRTPDFGTRTEPGGHGHGHGNADSRVGVGDDADAHLDTPFYDNDDASTRIGAGFQADEDAGHLMGPGAHHDADDDESDEKDDVPTPIILGESRTRYHGETNAGRAPPEFLDGERQARRSFVRSLWGYACVFGLLVLAAQFLFVYRTTIAGMAPQLRPLLVGLCEPVGCEVGYVRHLDRISITSSSLQPPSGQAGAPQQDDMSKLVLRASLRNQYDQPQPWPALRLDLSDLSDTVVIRKILLPENYLPKGQDQRPFEAGAEINIVVPIEVRGPHVTGFQLHKFFP